MEILGGGMAVPLQICCCADTVIVSGVAGRTPKNICLRCDLQFQYPAQPDTEKLEIDLRQIFFGGRPATPDTSIPQLYNQGITRVPDQTKVPYARHHNPLLIINFIF